MDPASHFNQLPKEVTSGTSHDGSFSWDQTIEDVTLTLSVPLTTTKRDVQFKLNPTYISVRVEKDEAVFKAEGNLFKNVEVDESSWHLTEEDGQRVVSVFLVKARKFLWRWVIEGHYPPPAPREDSAMEGDDQEDSSETSDETDDEEQEAEEEEEERFGPEQKIIEEGQRLLALSEDESQRSGTTPASQLQAHPLPKSPAKPKGPRPESGFRSGFLQPKLVPSEKNAQSSSDKNCDPVPADAASDAAGAAETTQETTVPTETAAAEHGAREQDPGGARVDAAAPAAVEEPRAPGINMFRHPKRSVPPSGVQIEELDDDTDAVPELNQYGPIQHPGGPNSQTGSPGYEEYMSSRGNVAEEVDNSDESGDEENDILKFGMERMMKERASKHCIEEEPLERKILRMGHMKSGADPTLFLASNETQARLSGRPASAPLTKEDMDEEVDFPRLSKGRQGSYKDVPREKRPWIWTLERGLHKSCDYDD
ncbi:hypothetical protein CYMTET_41378 [Cymbomonas tetramitiformis]|uniref:CS domain-containing protein n=1 Tax=Cymbomonas tetramitiformis TaxID=36881 RepID=A0AAE0C7M3_9CHLO|nr:hypothetical protein CYMTET_41378 [Cymbomonas tetramitiformis]